MSLTHVYVLRLAGGRKYVGISDDPAKALVVHKEGGVSAWTDRYPPERIQHIEYRVRPADLDRYVLRYMVQYGIENVRGGTWSTVRLTEVDQRAIRRQMAQERRDCCIQ